MKNMDVRITILRRVPERVFRKVRNDYGLTWDKAGGCFKGRVNEKKIRKLKRYCSWHHMKFELDNSYGKRSTDYRLQFFKHYGDGMAYRGLMGMFKRNGTFFYCAYCHRKIPKYDITIDHIYPVAKVNSTPKLQAKLRNMGYRDVNDYRNLTPACFKCNRRKSTKLNWWYITMGRLGQHQEYIMMGKKAGKMLFFIIYLIVMASIVVSSTVNDGGQVFIREVSSNLSPELSGTINAVIDIMKKINDMAYAVSDKISEMIMSAVENIKLLV